MPGKDTRKVVASSESEQETLAMIDHQNIIDTL